MSRSTAPDPERFVLAAPDKFAGTATAAEVATAIASGARRARRRAARQPLADGGEGTVDAFGGPNRSSVVTGPLGSPVTAAWRLDGELAVIEMAAASGLAVAGGRLANDPLRATTRGTGELIATAIGAGARRIIVGVGGSATTDGGLGAIEALGRRAFTAGEVEVEVACDVDTVFTDAAAVFGPQKGADAAMVAALSERLVDLVATYREEFGADLSGVAHGGAAGGLAGGLLALGARLRSGFELIAEHVGLAQRLAAASLVITGEGRVDATSAAGKVVGGVARLADVHSVPLLVVAGAIADDAPAGLNAVALSARYGEERSLSEPLPLVTEVVADYLRG